MIDEKRHLVLCKLLASRNRVELNVLTCKWLHIYDESFWQYENLRNYTRKFSRQTDLRESYNLSIKQKKRVTRARHRSFSREFSNHRVASGYVNSFSAWAHATFQYIRLRAFKMLGMYIDIKDGKRRTRMMQKMRRRFIPTITQQPWCCFFLLFPCFVLRFILNEG